MNAENEKQAEFLLLSNLEQVFNEHDAARRLEALGVLWSDDAQMFEAEEALAGRQAISDNVGKLHLRMPPDARFHPAGPVILNHDAALLRWAVGTDPAEPIVTGTDVAFIVGGRIRALYVFLDRRSG